jgi:hypothetical protein
VQNPVNPVNPVENFWDPDNRHNFQSPGISLINPVKSLPVSDWIDSLIVPRGSLTHFSPSLSFMGGVGKQ